MRDFTKNKYATKRKQTKIGEWLLETFGDYLINILSFLIITHQYSIRNHWRGRALKYLQVTSLKWNQKSTSNYFYIPQELLRDRIVSSLVLLMIPWRKFLL